MAREFRDLLTVPPPVGIPAVEKRLRLYALTSEEAEDAAAAVKAAEALPQANRELLDRISALERKIVALHTANLRKARLLGLQVVRRLRFEGVLAPRKG